MEINYTLEDSDNELTLLFLYKNKDNTRRLKYTYIKNVLKNLFKHQNKENFMNYQFKYISEQIQSLEIKEFIMIKKQEIREKIIKLLGLI